MFEEKTFKVCEERYISYFDIGKGKKVLLFIHGWLVSKESWIPLIKNFDLNEYRIIAVDLLGHGNSSRSLKLEYNTLEQTSILAKFIFSLKLKNITVIGHSTGGKLALFLTEFINNLSPNSIKKVILINSIGTYEFWRSLHPILKLAFFKPIRFLIGLLTLDIYIDFYFKKFLLLIPMNDEVKKNIADYISEPTKKHFESIRNKIVALRITKNLFDVFIEDIDKSKIPDVEIIWSQDDKLVNLPVQMKFSQLFSKPIFILRNSGHMTPIEIPNNLYETLINLL
jgi:pimeloyl-ACP methyl ester carboxylesterase